MTTRDAVDGDIDQVCPRCSAEAGKPCRRFGPTNELTDNELATGRVHLERGDRWTPPALHRIDEWAEKRGDEVSPISQLPFLDLPLLGLPPCGAARDKYMEELPAEPAVTPPPGSIPPPPPTISWTSWALPEELAAAAGISTRTLSNWVRDGRAEKRRVPGGRVCFRLLPTDPWPPSPRDVHGEHDQMRAAALVALEKLMVLRDQLGRYVAASAALGVDPQDAVVGLIDEVVAAIYVAPDLPKRTEPPKRRTRGAGGPRRREGGGQGRTTRRGDGRTRLAKEISAEPKETSSSDS
jgi:hypothetical protein